MRMTEWKKTALAWRSQLIPDALGLEWAPFYWLGYVVFLFIPMLFGWIDARGVIMTLATIPPFLWLYFRGYRTEGRRLALPILGIAALSYALVPFNPFANTYMVFVAAFCALLGTLPLALSVFGVLLMAFVIQVLDRKSVV